VQAIWRTLTAWCGALLRGLVYLLASPAIILADLVQPDSRFDRAWVVGFMGFVTVIIVLSWGFGYAVTVETLQGNALTAAYVQIGPNLSDAPYLDLIQIYAARNGLDPALVAAVISQESRFQADAVSPAGARGLMQILPSTWRALSPDSTCDGSHAPPACGPDCIFDPEANIRAGTSYFADLLEEFNGDLVLAFAAYNAGAGAVRRHSREVEPVAGFDDLPPFAETRNYVHRVLSLWVNLKSGSVPDVVHLSVEESRLLRQIATALPVAVLSLWGLFCLWVLRRFERR